jgi:hypothetical protein
MSSVCCKSNGTGVTTENVSEYACQIVHYGTHPIFHVGPDLPILIFKNEAENNEALHLKLLD